MRVKAQINPIMEAITYFKYKAYNKKITDTLLKYSDLPEKIQCELKARFTPIEELERVLDEKLSFPLHAVKELFKSFDDGAGLHGMDPISVVFLEAAYFEYTGFDSVIKMLFEYNAKKQRELIMSALTMNKELLCVHDAGYEHFLKFIDELSYPAGEKWRIVSTYNKFADIISDASAMLKPAVDIIESHYAMYETVINDFYLMYRDMPMRPYEYIKDQYGANIPAFENETLFPCLFGYCDIRSMYYDEPEEFSMTYVGVLVDFIVKSARGQLMPGDCDRILKALNDPNRVNILKYLRDNKAYGLELAAKLRLSPNTISHHINKLQSNGLITAESEGNRIYYSSNKENIQRFLDVLSRLFIGDIG